MPDVAPPAPPRTEPFVAVEFDVLDDQGNPVTLLLSGGGMATVMRNGIPYYPRLTNLPILLGSTITVTQYGSPVRAQPNAGVIQFRFDESIWIWTAYHWIGRPFRVYEGSRATPFATIVDVDADMALVYVGRVDGFTHDCFTVSIKTTDASLDLDNPMVTNFYDVTFPVAIQGKPKPTVRGKFFSAEPVIVNETSQTYEVQSLPQGLDSIDEVRVGGVPWPQVPSPPTPGTWSPVNIAGIFQQLQLGSPPAGQDVRVDGTAGSFMIGQLISDVVTNAGGEVDSIGLAALDTDTQLQQASLVTTTSPVNRLNAIDDVVTSGGCWWGFNTFGQGVASAIAAPAAVGKYKLTEVEIHTISLNTIQPLAWRLRIGSQRNWQPESSFDDGVLQTDVYKWASPSLVYEPHYENPNALVPEPRAVDVPLLNGTSPNPQDAANEQARLIAAWGVNRTVFDVTAWMRPEDINLYDTIEVDYMMVTGTFRIVSAIRAIGGNGPATLQLWGTLGTVPPAPNPLPLPPAFAGGSGGGGFGGSGSGGGGGSGSGGSAAQQTGWVFDLSIPTATWVGYQITAEVGIFLSDGVILLSEEIDNGGSPTILMHFLMTAWHSGQAFGDNISIVSSTSGSVAADTSPGHGTLIVKQTPWSGNVTVNSTTFQIAQAIPAGGTLAGAAALDGSSLGTITVTPYYGS